MRNGQKFRLTDDTEGSRRSQVQNILRRGLEGRRKKFFESFDVAFDWFGNHVDIDEHLWDINPDSRGLEYYWQQDVRNAAKTSEDWPDCALIRRELVAFKRGGFSLPGHIPDGKVSIDLPREPQPGLVPPRDAKTKTLQRPQMSKQERTQVDYFIVQILSLRAPIRAYVMQEIHKGKSK